MAGTFKPSYCIEGALPAVTEGQFYVTTDTNRIFADLEGTRICTNDFITVDNEASLPLVAVKGKLYIALAERTLWIYSAGWIQVDTPAIASTTHAGVVKIDGTSIKIDDNGVISTSIDNIMTEAQINAINSGITSDKVTIYDGYSTEISTLKSQVLYFDELK